MRIETERKMRRWREQRWILDQVIQAGGSTGTRDGQVKYYVTAAPGFKGTFKKFAEESRSSSISHVNSRAPQPGGNNWPVKPKKAGHLPEAREHYYIAATFYTNAMWGCTKTETEADKPGEKENGLVTISYSICRPAR